MGPGWPSSASTPLSSPLSNKVRASKSRWYANSRVKAAEAAKQVACKDGQRTGPAPRPQLDARPGPHRIRTPEMKRAGFNQTPGPKVKPISLGGGMRFVGGRVERPRGATGKAIFLPSEAV